MKGNILLTLGVLLAASPALAADPLTLNEALAAAAKNHPQLHEAAAGLDAAEAKLGQAQAAYWPQINLAADWSRGDTFLTALGAIKRTEVATTTLTLRHNLYDFGRTGGANDAAREAAAAAAEDLKINHQDVAFRVKAAWNLALAAEKRVTAARKNLEARQIIAKQAEEFFRHGIRSRVDVARAEAALFTGKSLLLQAENNQRLARLELAGGMGIESIGDRIIVETEPEKERPAKELRQLQEEALRQRSELKRLALLRESATGSLRAAHGGYLPVVTGMASYGQGGAAILPEGEVWSLGFGATLPLFSGFSTAEQVREIEAVIRGLKARQKNLRQQVEREVEAAWLALQESASRLATSEKEALAAGENLRLAMERYREGLGTMVETADAQALAINAETSLIQAGYDQRLAWARLERVLGSEHIIAGEK